MSPLFLGVSREDADTVMGLFGIAGRLVFEVESAKGGCGGGSGGIAGMVKGDDGSVMVEGVLNEL